MRSKNSGQIFVVKDGVHSQKLIIAYNRDQHEEIRQAKKIAAYVTKMFFQGDLFGDAVPKVEGGTKPVLFDPANLRRIGFID